jgi:chromosome segregation ATPase
MKQLNQIAELQQVVADLQNQRAEMQDQIVACRRAISALQDIVRATAAKERVRDELDKNKTAADAVARVNRARIGSLAENPTADYLRSLMREITRWREKVHEALDRHPDYDCDDHPRMEYC